MQTVSTTVELVSYVTGVPRNRVNQMARALIDAGILPKSVGRTVMKITAEDVFYLLAAVAFADKVAEAADVAKAIAYLPAQGGDAIDQFEGQTFGQVFGAMMRDTDSFTPAKLEINRMRSGYSGMMAFDYKSDDEILGVQLPFWTEKSWGGWTKTSFVLSSEGVEILRNLFLRDDSEGMVFRLVR